MPPSAPDPRPLEHTASPIITNAALYACQLITVEQVRGQIPMLSLYIVYQEFCPSVYKDIDTHIIITNLHLKQHL